MITYKEDLRKDLLEILNQFFQQDAGNRLTTFNMNGLLVRINEVFDKNQSKEEKKDAQIRNNKKD